MVNISKLCFLSICIAFCIASCNITKNVPKGYYLLNSNKITINQKVSFKDDLNEILKLKPNKKILGIRLKLRAHNLIDSTKLAEKRIKANEKFHEKLKKKREKYTRINLKRIERAKRKGKLFYTEKIIKDTINESVLFREKVKYKFGEEPLVFDSIAFKKTEEQIYNYLRKKGYYSPVLLSELVFDSLKRRVDITYKLELGKVFRIDSIFYSGNALMIRNHDAYLKKRLKGKDPQPLLGKSFDIDLLDSYRNDFARNMRNEAYFKYSASTIVFIADTSYSDMGVVLEMKFNQQMVPFNENSDSLVVKPFYYTKINEVHFHLSDKFV